MDIRDCQLATGRRVSCDGCWQVAWYVRPAKNQPINSD